MPSGTRRRGVDLVVGDVLCQGPHGQLRIASFEPRRFTRAQLAWMKERRLGRARYALDHDGHRQLVVDAVNYTIYPKETH